MSSVVSNLRVSVKLIDLSSKGLRSCVLRCGLGCAGIILLAGSSGCASSGALQPHQAFRQTATPYQAYFQGQRSGLGQSNLGNAVDTGSASDFAGYGGGAASGQGVFGQQSPPVNTPFSRFSPIGPAPSNGGFNYQPNFGGGFFGGTC